jgi:hypothetical protein
MTIQVINTGSSANSGNGDSLRVAFTKVNNNFAELADTIAIATSNQSLNTTDNVIFRNLTISSGTTVAKTLSVGGYPLDSNGQILIRLDGTESPTMLVSNYTSPQRSDIIVRSYGENRPNGTENTSGAPLLTFESSRGTNLIPTAVKNGDILGFIGVGGYDGANWSASEEGLHTGSLTWESKENWNHNGNTTTNVGTTLKIRVHPIGIRLTNDSIMPCYSQNWQSNIDGPPTLASVNGAISNPILTNSDGTVQHLGFGASTFRWQNGTMILHGVTMHDYAEVTGNINGTLLTVNSIATGILSVGQQLTGNGVLFNTKITALASGTGGTGTYVINNSQIVGNSTITAGPDNKTLIGTNIITIAGHRTSGISGNRNPLKISDHLGQFNFRGQTSGESFSSGAVGA